MTEDKNLSYRQVMVGGFPTGLKGLDEIFETLYDSKTALGDELGPALVAHARKYNYIATSADTEFAAALVRAYADYRAQRERGETAKKVLTWHGIPRERIPWFPLVDETLCDGCDKCLQFCPNKVYTRDLGGTICVASPMNCEVGCDACARLCPPRAITFPPRAMLGALVREGG
jgi:NAD-dependent dihydropyrimidine dehydrogenase PreA subunit